MSYSQKIGRWICIFLAGIILYFWVGDIGNILKEIGEGLYMLFEKWIRTPYGKFFSWIKAPLDWTIPKITEDPVLQFIFIVFCFILTIFFLLVVLFFGIIWLILFLIAVIFLLIRAVGVGIIEVFPRIKDFSLTGYILSVSVLAYISGRFFHSIIFPWLCQQAEMVLALGIEKIFYRLPREKKIKLNQYEEQKEEIKLEEIENEYIVKKNKTEELHNALIKLTEGVSPELLGFVSSDIFKYKSWWEEIYKRHKIKQILKTTKTANILLDEIKKLWKKRIDVHQAMIDYAKVVDKLSKLKKELIVEKAIEDKRMIEKFERVELEEKLERLKIEKQIAQLESEIKKFKSLTFQDGFLQKARHKINELKAREAGIKMLSEEREKQLSDPELQKNKETYQKVKNMWDDAIIEFLERE